MPTSLAMTAPSSQDGNDISTSTRKDDQPDFALSTLHFSPLSTTGQTISPIPGGTHLPPSDQSISQRRTPRPANAFILFRSDFLKRGVIPNDVERRQQNLSRIAGQVWNLLEPTEKAKWHAQAVYLLEEHRRKNPETKVTRVRTSGSRLSNKQPCKNNMTEDEIRKIREMYTGSTPSRKRRVSPPLDSPHSHTSTSESLPRHHIESTTALTMSLEPRSHSPHRPQTPHCLTALPTDGTPCSPPSSPSPLPRPMETHFSPLNDFLSTASPKPHSHSPHTPQTATAHYVPALSLPMEATSSHFSPLNDSVVTATTLPAPPTAASLSLFSFICGRAAEVFK